MKKLWTLMAMVAVFTSCSQEEADSPLNTYTLTGYADMESRTAFGTPGTSSIPFQWSVNDYIYVGSTQSEPISNGGSSATFTFNTTPSDDNVFYNMTGISNQADVKAIQTIGNLGTNGDFGYGTISNGSFTLNHATSYLWFDVTSSHNSSVTLQSVKVSADVNIAGKATWDGNSLGSVSEGNKSIELSVNEALSSTNDNVWAMVVLPNLASKSFKVTYKLKVGNNTRYYTETITGKQNFTSGKTQKVSLEITNNTPLTDYAELRVLTFEDDTEKFETYTITGYDGDNGSYYDHSVTKWSDLIDTPEYGGPLAYGDMGFYGESRGCDYNWYDNNNTFLASEFPVNYNSKVYWGGGHVISSYASEDYTTYGTYENQQTVYGEGQVYGVTKTGGRNGSSNFAMHYGYKDSSPYNMTENLPYIYFKDNTPRIIDHMYVNNSAYAISCYMDGNGLTAKIDEEDWVKAIATGYDIDGNVTGTAEIYLCNGPDNIVTEWTKWDLTSLGMVYKVEFNITGSSDNGYGFSQPAYFAYDDVAVQFTE